MAPFVDDRLKSEIRSFNERGKLGADPLAARYAERRAGYTLFARMMGGDVTEPGKGSVFTVHLPSGGHTS